MHRPFAGLYQELWKVKPLAVAIPRDLKEVSVEAAWKMLDVVEHTELTIERVLRRELNALFGKWRKPQRSFVRRPPPKVVRF